MDVSQRLDLYRQSINLTISQMADMAGIPRPTLWQFLNGRNKTLRDDMAAKIHDTFPSLNIMWLMFGEGPMALEQNMKISEAQKADISAPAPPQFADNKIDSKPYIPNLFAQENCENSERAVLAGTIGSPQSISEAETARPDYNQAKIQQSVDTIAAAATATSQPDNPKHIQSIMVFYSDNSFEIFKPSAPLSHK